MKKILTILFLTLFTGASYAEVNFGVSGAFTRIDTSGSEVEGGETTNKSLTHDVFVPSLFVEMGITDRITVGLDYIPIDADVSDKTHKRTDTETSVTGTATTTSTSRTQTADAELENHYSIYADVMVNDDVFVKVGAVQVDLNTMESLGTGSVYANETIDGYLLGVGFKSDAGFGKFMKVELIHTDYDEVSISSSVARTGVTTNNKITADLDTTALKVSFAF
jgi:hypothetical protein